MRPDAATRRRREWLTLATLSVIFLFVGAIAFGLVV